MSGEVAPPVEGTLRSLRAAMHGPPAGAERNDAGTAGADGLDGEQDGRAGAGGQHTRSIDDGRPGKDRAGGNAAGEGYADGFAGEGLAGEGLAGGSYAGESPVAAGNGTGAREDAGAPRDDVDATRGAAPPAGSAWSSDTGEGAGAGSDVHPGAAVGKPTGRDLDTVDQYDDLDDDEIFADPDDLNGDDLDVARLDVDSRGRPRQRPHPPTEPVGLDEEDEGGTVLPLRDHGRSYRDDSGARPAYRRPAAGEGGYPAEGGRMASWGGARPGGLPDGSQSAAATLDDDASTSGGFGLAGAPTGRRVRARLARFNAPWQTPQVSEVLEPLIATHRASHPKADQRLLQRAYDVANTWHAGQYRKSGDQYITHPLAVATILANLGMDTTTLVAALLHDTIEDTDYTIEQMRADFGGEVALLVDGVTKLDRVKLGDAAKAETIRKMVVAMAKDPRVLVIKLADRLHNMRTLMFLPRAKQEQKARETLEILAPLAHRLGMNTIKWELEDLAFQTLFPKRFEEINRLIGDHAPQREALLRQVTQKVAVDLKAAKIKAEVTGRPKHLYSVYQKMIVRGREFADIYDLVGVRILVDTVRDCYAALGVIHANWQPVPGRFKDYIAMPKFNMYQSLHTTVIGPTGKPVEMQIRTYAMHRTAEYGIAAHWRYKETKGATIAGPPAHIDEMTWLRQLLDWQREASDPSEFLDALRFDLSSQEVYVFTPKGDVIPLPTGSTPVDFAYAVHTEVGHKCIGARVNGKLVPLESTLSNGDVIEIFTSKSDTAGPSQDWLGFVKSPRARTKIRQYFNKERREEAIEAGKEAIVKAMRKQGLPLQRLLTSDALLTIARDHHLADVSALYAAVGENQLSAQSIVQRLVAGFGGEEGAMEDIAETAIPTRQPRHRGSAYDPGVEVRGIDDVWIKLARCCTPVPGDSVFGFVTRSGGVSVHREDCANADDLRAQPERILDVTWKPTSASTFLVAIQVEALDRHKLLADITKVLSDEKVNILSATVTTTRDRVAVSRFSFEMADPKHLGHLLAAVRRVDGVYDAYRVTSGA